MSTLIIKLIEFIFPLTSGFSYAPWVATNRGGKVVYCLADPQEVLVDIRERLVRVETKLDNQNDLRGRVGDVETKATETESRSKSNCHRLDKIEASYTWLWRTVIGAIIAAGVSAVVAFK